MNRLSEKDYLQVISHKIKIAKNNLQRNKKKMETVFLMKLMIIKKKKLIINLSQIIQLYQS